MVKTSTVVVVATILFGSLFSGWLCGWDGGRNPVAGLWALLTIVLAGVATMASEADDV